MSAPVVRKIGSHYIANILITKVDKTEISEYGKAPVVSRQTSTIARVVVSDEVLETLMQKIAQHTAVIDDRGDIDA